MKERRLELTLDNLDCEEAKNCPYVLTSPRSLEACKVMGVKPVELLYRSVGEVREQLSVTASLDRVIAVYQRQEKLRRSKLEACRAVRDHLVALSGPVPSLSSPEPRHKENRDPSPNLSPKPRGPSPSASKRSSSPGVVTFKPRDKSPGTSAVSRKEQLDRENAARARLATTGCEALRAVENRWEVANVKPPRSPALPPRPPRSLPAVCTSPSKKKSKVRKVIAPRVRPSSETPLPSVTSRSSAESATWRPKSGASCSSAASAVTRPTGRRAISSATSGSATSDRSSPVRASRVRVCPRWGGLTDRNNNSSAGKRSGSARRRPQLSCWPVEGVSVPEHDRRILESMAMKRESERAAEELAHEAHIAWEHARQEREQEQLEQTQRWKEHVAEKRRLEGANNERKLAELRDEEVRSQQRLQDHLLEKEARSAAQLRSAEERKFDDQGDRAGAAERQRAAVLWARDQLQHEGTLWRLAVEKGQSTRLQRAEEARVNAREVNRRRVASANRVEEVRRAERRAALQSESEEALRLLREQCREKERRAELLLERAAGERDRHLRGASEARSSRLSSARELHEELEAGLERWRVQCATLQQEAAGKAERRAQQQNRERQRRAEAANRAREEHHGLVMSRVSAEQRALEEARRNAILAKEDKMRRLQLRRDQAVHESRAQAHTTAELRDQIRRTMSPETFDRLVARTALEVRVTASRPTTASPPATRSHILLG